MSHSEMKPLSTCQMITDQLWPLLERYHDLLLEENKKVNLVSRETNRGDLVRITAECLAPWAVTNIPAAKNYLDIGSGGGFPSIPLLISGCASSATVVERTQKKASAIAGIASALSLSVETIPRTFEEVSFDQTFDLVTLRWVKLTRKLQSMILTLLDPGGLFVYYSDTNLQFDSEMFHVKQVSFTLDDLPAVKHLTIVTKQS